MGELQLKYAIRLTYYSLAGVEQPVEADNSASAKADTFAVPGLAEEEQEEAAAARGVTEAPPSAEVESLSDLQEEAVVAVASRSKATASKEAEEEAVVRVESLAAKSEEAPCSASQAELACRLVKGSAPKAEAVKC